MFIHIFCSHGEETLSLECPASVLPELDEETLLLKLLPKLFVRHEQTKLVVSFLLLASFHIPRKCHASC